MLHACSASRQASQCAHFDAVHNQGAMSIAAHDGDVHTHGRIPCKQWYLQICTVTFCLLCVWGGVVC